MHNMRRYSAFVVELFASILIFFLFYRCDKDNTIRHYTSGLKQLHQFSIQAFTFVINHRYVYFHCDLVICHKNTPNSICKKSTSCPTRKRRDERSADDGSKVYQLSAGPLIYRSKKDNTNSKGKYTLCSQLSDVSIIIVHD